MNWFHRQVCRSGRWRRRVERVLPWALQGVSLGDDVLEIGPGPGITTDLLKGWTQRLTALEVAANLEYFLRGLDLPMTLSIGRVQDAIHARADIDDNVPGLDRAPKAIPSVLARAEAVERDAVFVRNANNRLQRGRAQMSF